MAFKMNKVKVDLCSYPQYVIIGQRGIGKTTLFRDIVIEEYGSPEFGLLISCGNESGYHALDNLQVEEVREWSKEYGFPESEEGVPEEFWTRGLVEVIDDLVFNKSNYKIKLVCFDTLDELYPMAEQRVFYEHKKKKGSYPESLNSALGGYGAGQNRAVELVTEQMARLLNAGYGVFFIGHVKVKDKIDPVTGDVYEQYTNNLSNKYFGAVADSAQMVVNIVNELNVTGGSDDKAGRITGSTRSMYFRDTGLIDAKSRFVGMPEKMPLSAQNFLQAFKEGVKNSQSNPISEKEMKKQLAEEKKESKILAETSAKNEQKVDSRRKEDLVVSIKDAMKQILSVKDATNVAKLQALFKEYQIGNADAIDKLELAQLISLLAAIEKLK